jgi:hypothetical protein
VLEYQRVVDRCYQIGETNTGQNFLGTNDFEVNYTQIYAMHSTYKNQKMRSPTVELRCRRNGGEVMYGKRAQLL